jgi:dipeptidyl-peptidase-4
LRGLKGYYTGKGFHSNIGAHFHAFRYNRNVMQGIRCVCALVAIAIAAAGKKPVTLEALASYQPPAAMGAPVWSPDGKQFVYTEGVQVWLYDIASRGKRELVSLDALEAAATKVPKPVEFGWQNRRVEEQAVQWMPSGRELLIDSGGDLFLVPVSGSHWIQLTASAEVEHDPKVSPDGRRVSFRRGHNLYVMELASKKVNRVTSDGSATRLNGELDWVYPEELELGTAHWWSPDSRSIAYLQFDVSREPLYPQVDLVAPKAIFEPQRYPQAGDPNAEVRLGVLPATGGHTRWMRLGPQDALLARFTWLPDSSGIAVERLNRIQNRLDLLVANARTGAVRTLLSETDPYWINLHDGLTFLKSGTEFLWPSERGGFNHLYRFSIDGRQLAQLTRGEWEVTEVAGVDAQGRVYYVSSEAGPLERQLYRVDANGDGKQRLTAAAGTHTISMSPDASSYVDSFSSLTEPPRKTLCRADGTEWAVLREANRSLLEEYDVRPLEIVPVQASDGTMLYGRLIRPAGMAPGRQFPAIVVVYGGPGVQTVANHWYGSLTLEQVLAARGFAVWSLDGRGSTGRGHKWETAVFRNLGARELEDQKEGVRHLLSLGFIDSKRVGIEGWSYGGFMTLYSLLHAPEIFACGLAGAPVTNWRNYDSIYTERYMGLPAENTDAYQKASPVNAAENLKGRLLIVHNFEDDNVLFANTAQMVTALERAAKPFELMLFPEKTHGVAQFRQDLNELVVSFFERSLK